MRGYGEFEDFPQIMFAILGGDFPIVVDTGAPDPDFVRRHHRYDYVRAEDEHPVDALRAIGVEVEDVPMVINTHLHWDHCGNNVLFVNAEFIVQQSELHFAIDPIRQARLAYENTAEMLPPWAPVLNRFRTVRGDVGLTAEISLVTLPGHSPGSQGVLVDTDAGRFLLAGDCVDSYANWAGDDRLPHIPGGVFIDMVDYMESFDKIEGLERQGVQIIPSHDQRVLDTGVFG